MDPDLQRDLINKVAFPRAEYASPLLSELGLDGFPTPNRVYRDIEESLLLPKERLPDRWLDTYQV